MPEHSDNQPTVRHAGSCMCGAVRYETSGPLEPVSVCHCTQCRRWTGHLFASTSVKTQTLKIKGETELAWYDSSKKARRGFCKKCGSSLFWQRNGSDIIDILAGTFDQPTDLAIERHIYVADKGDYYEIEDGLPQFPQYGRIDDASS